MSVCSQLKKGLNINMYRMNQNRGMASRQRYDIDAHERMLSRRNMNCNSCNMNENVSPALDRNEGTCRYEDYSSDEYNYSLAMVYSPVQTWENLYCEDEGFVAGTIFKELDKPFYGAKCHGGNCNE